ncbi:MAG TPA: hypothetical protein VK348_11055, partial [Planctomycetota bacterium]|nr:hypothetical protein [Planctomycetota bacterium]
AYADAMRQVYQKFPWDPDVGVLFAEAMLDLSPWNQWNKDGSPRPGTEEILTVLTGVLQQYPQQPMAIHLYIHATEASPHPELALDAAARLPALAPRCGHLVHMPAHTLQRCGQYDKALQANLAGIAVDHAYFADAGPQGIYHMYLAHNQHFACYAAMFTGQSAIAVRCARELVADIPVAMKEQTPEFVDGFLALPLHALLRFGRWEEVLVEPAPGPKFPVATALRHYARGVALAALGRTPEARMEEKQFTAAVDAVPAGATVGLTPAADVLGVARCVLTGEVAFRFGEREAAFTALRAGVAAEDALRYDEPSGWMMPVRHTLGALLLEAGDVEAAQAVYQEDLLRHPGNGWSLHGLAECQRRRGDPATAATEAALLAAWAGADVKLSGSCFCRRAP